MTIAKIVSTWTGIVGQPGYTVMYVRSTAANPSPIFTFFDSIKAYLPVSANVNVPNTGPLLDELTGKETGVWSQGLQQNVIGTGTSAYAPSQGAQVKWTTADWVNGRRVVGRTFLVPLMTGVYGTGGVIATATANAINAAATALISGFSGNFVVWARPLYKAGANPGDPPVLERQGSLHTITTATTPTKPCTLNSRRDS